MEFIAHKPQLLNALDYWSFLGKPLKTELFKKFEKFFFNDDQRLDIGKYFDFIYQRKYDEPSLFDDFANYLINDHNEYFLEKMALFDRYGHYECLVNLYFFVY